MLIPDNIHRSVSAHCHPAAEMRKLFPALLPQVLNQTPPIPMNRTRSPRRKQSTPIRTAYRNCRAAPTSARKIPPDKCCGLKSSRHGSHGESRPVPGPAAASCEPRYAAPPSEKHHRTVCLNPLIYSIPIFFFIFFFPPEAQIPAVDQVPPFPDQSANPGRQGRTTAA